MTDYKHLRPKWTAGGIILAVSAAAILTYGVWLVHASHKSTSVLAQNIKVKQTPTGHNHQLADDVLAENVSELLSPRVREILMSTPSWFNDQRRGYHLVLSDSICWKMQSPTESTDVKAYRGIRVEETIELLDKFPKIVDGYKIIIIHLGTNNLLTINEATQQMFSVAEIHSAYNRLCEKIRAINPNCTLFSSSILPRVRDTDLSFHKLREVNSLLEASFGKRFIRTGDEFIGIIDGQLDELRFKEDLYVKDGLHLSEKGKMVLSQKFRQVLTDPIV